MRTRWNKGLSLNKKRACFDELVIKGQVNHDEFCANVFVLHDVDHGGRGADKKDQTEMIEFMSIYFGNGFDGNGGNSLLSHIFMKFCNITKIAAAVDLNLGMKVMETFEKINDGGVVGMTFGGIDQ